MERLTKEEALQGCKRVWLWVAETGENKLDYPFEERPRNLCYACEYDDQNSGRFCNENCIISWPGGSCIAGESPYKAYCHAATYPDEKEAALAIAALCDKALEALHEERAFGHDLSQAL
jgi:hypothetical protein